MAELMIDGCEWGRALTDLQGKAEKYESKAAKYKECADQTQGAQREFYDILAFYYGDLAFAFRQALARRGAG